MTKRNEPREDRIFRAFLEATGMGGPSTRFEHKAPPHPDILYFGDGGEQIAFELTELIDENLVRSTAAMNQTYNEFPKRFNCQERSIRNAITKEYSDAMISITFRGHVSMNRRRTLLDDVFGFLAQTQFEEAGRIPLTQKLANDVKHITVRRGSTDGPRFAFPHVGYINDPTVPSIEAKFSKTYTPDGPIHLLAYVDGHPMFPDDVWLESAKSFVRQRGPQGQFDAIWIFHVDEGIKYKWDR